MCRIGGNDSLRIPGKIPTCGTGNACRRVAPDGIVCIGVRVAVLVKDRIAVQTVFFGIQVCQPLILRRIGHIADMAVIRHNANIFGHAGFFVNLNVERFPCHKQFGGHLGCFSGFNRLVRNRFCRKSCLLIGAAVMRIHGKIEH